MKKITLLLSLTLFSMFAMAQPFAATYTFDSVKTTSGLIDPSFVPTATGITFGSFTSVGTNPNSLATFRFDFPNWPTGSLGGVADTFYSGMTGSMSTAEYYEVTLTPTGSYSMSLDSIKFGMERSGTGIRTYSVRSSVDGYATNLTAIYVAPNTNVDVQSPNTFFLRKDITTPQNRNVIFLNSGAGFLNVTSPITFRFYGWNSEASTGTFSIDNVRFSGSVTAPTGISEKGIADVIIYPNPTSNGLITLETSASKSTVDVFNILGKNIYSKEINGKQTLDLSNQANGSYFITVKNAENTITKKIVIAK